jgi:hypothetical protein
MALTPGLYVPQGEVGTGAAYVHKIKDRSNELEAIAKAAEKQRVEQEKQMAKLKGFDYGKVVDSKMKEHISGKYKTGLETFAKITAAGGDIASISTPEGQAFSVWQNQIKDEADTASLAEANKEKFLTAFSMHPELYDTDIATAVIQDYDAATTPDDKLRATQNLDPLHLKQFDYNKWIQEEIEPAKTDKEITDLGEDITEYQNVYNKKLEEIPSILATKPGYRLAEVQWKKRKENGETGFDQPDFATFLTQQVEDQKIIRESKSESPAAKGMNVNVSVGGPTPSKADVVSTTPLSTTQLSVDVNKLASEGNLFFSEGDNDRDPYLEVKKGSGNPTDYGVGDYAFENPKAKGQGILIPSSDLWRLQSASKKAIKVDPNDKFAQAFAGKSFTDEKGKTTQGKPSWIYEDQLGNVWVDLVDEKGNSMGHVILNAGGLSQKFSKGGQSLTHPFVTYGQGNRQALEGSLGVNYQQFIDQYLTNNLE